MLSLNFILVTGRRLKLRAREPSDCIVIARYHWRAVCLDKSPNNERSYPPTGEEGACPPRSILASANAVGPMLVGQCGRGKRSDPAIKVHRGLDNLCPNSLAWGSRTRLWTDCVCLRTRPRRLPIQYQGEERTLPRASAFKAPAMTFSPCRID